MTNGSARAPLFAVFAMLAGLLLASCDDADTVIGVWAPIDRADAGSVEFDAAQPGDADVPDSGPPDASESAAAFYLEAEDGALAGPLQIGSSELASGGEFIVASEAAELAEQPGAARATYDFTLESGAEYVIWGRIHSPSASNNRYWVQVDDGIWSLWRISTGEAWFWDDVHDDANYGRPLVFALDAGQHRLTFANAVTGAELDRLYVTSLADHPPGNTTPCNPPHSIEVGGGCVRSCGSYGNVSCDPNACADRKVLDVYDCAICCSLD